jgi:hypothetical protein
MVTDQQVRLLMKYVRTEKTLSVVAAKAGMAGKMALSVIGDGHKVGKAQDLIRDGYELTKAI